MQQRFTVGAFAIILDAQGRVLLCLRGDCDRWNLPGGGVNAGEAPWEAVVREVQEETGLVVAVEGLVGVYARTGQDDLVFCFRCGVVSGVVQRTSEAREVGYFPVDALPPNVLKNHEVRIRDYFAQPQERGHVVMATQ